MSDIRIRDAAKGARRRTSRAMKELLGRSVAEPAAVPQPDANSADVALLVDSPLFDHDWYNRQVGGTRSRVRAAAHYLAQQRGASRAIPHPLFDPEFYADNLPPKLVEEMAARDPFVFYLRRRTWRRLTHPLFDTRGYLRRIDEARTWSGGPLRHYVETGRFQGLQPNDWMASAADGTYPDLVVWSEARLADWEARGGISEKSWRAGYDRAAEKAWLTEHAAEPWPVGVTVSVLLDAGLNEELLDATLASLIAQDTDAWELFVVDRGVDFDVAALVADAVPQRNARVLTTDDDHLEDACNEALAAASGTYVAFARGGEVWRPDRLRLLAGAASRTGARMVADVMSRETNGGKRRFAAYGHPAEGVCSRRAVALSRLVMERGLITEAGGFDTSLLGGRDFDLVLRASHLSPLSVIPYVGTEWLPRNTSAGHIRPSRCRRPVEHRHLDSWAAVALNRRVIDWEELGRREQDPGLVSVIIPTYDDWQMTSAAVESVLASDGHAGIRVETIVWDNGSAGHVSVNLDALAARFPQVVLAHSPANHGFALGNNLALTLAHGQTVMFLNNDTSVEPGWLEPVVARLQDPDVLGVQSLLLYPTGTVQSAGVVFPNTGGLPHAFLAGFPREDAEGIDRLEFGALTGAALAIRWRDAVALQGFDPIFTNGMEDVDLCQRLAETRSGGFRVVTDVPVTHYESRSPGRYARSIINRRIWLDRWRNTDTPRDDVAMWAAQGFEVLGHEVVPLGPAVRRSWLLPAPVLARRRLKVTEHPPRLRWAIKNPAPAGVSGDRWGDTHFAEAIARALREHGQWVTIDRLEEHDRRTGRHDDIALALRGLADYQPSPEQVTLMWVISHPEMVSRASVVECDRVLAASSQWAEAMSEKWGLRIDPLLQATDPSLFNPDRAVADTGHPVLFVGASRNIERPIVRAAVAAGLPISIYGHGWKPFVDKRYIKAEHLLNTDLGAAYRSAGVVLNDHWEDMREAGFVSNRLFDAVASGARVISDDVAGIRDLFGDSVQVYRGEEDLVRLSSLADPDSVFGTDKERRATAERIHREHSFLARGRELIEIAVEERKKRGFA